MSTEGKKEVCDLVLDVLQDLKSTLPALGRPIKLHIDLGFEMLAQKKFVEAATAFDAGLALDPYDDECKRGKQELQIAIHCNTGEALLGSKKYAKAITAFELGLALDPNDAACRQGVQRSQV
jgi:tetratricopeptide (TPR) repeat protein